MSAVALAVGAWFNARRRAAITRGRRLLHDVRDGEAAAVVGRVILRSPALRAPFSGRDCASFRGYKSRYIDHGGAGGNVEEGHAEAYSDFDLEDQTGRARVTMSRGVVVEDPPVGVGRDGEWSCFEWALTEGLHVCVVGVARWEQVPTLEVPSRGAPPTASGPFREAPRGLRIDASRIFSV
ncbi:MAG: hypothetical protein HY909_20655 [Deltaproteobacteria bacterium]|nr:hypothetical protein [Deltaproteobacteria bacterium]